MNAISYTAARNNLAKTMDKVNDDHAPVLITRQNGAPAVLIALEDFSAYEETAYLMSSPQNAKRLRRAVRQLKAGKGKARKLIR
jgi:antitoxin YefM